MPVGKVNVAYRFWMGAQLGSGLLASGIASGDFAVTVRDPGNTTTMASPVVNEVGATGLYFFDIPAAFTNTNGAGTYGVHVEVDSAAPLSRGVIVDGVDFFDADIDDIDLAVDACKLNVAFVPGTNQMRIGAWLTRNGVNVASPTAITLIWFDADGDGGSPLFTLTEVDAESGPPSQDPDADGRYLFLRTQAVADDQVYKVLVEITDANGTVTTFKDVQTVATS